MPPPGEEDHAAITGTVRSPDELGSAPKGGLAQVGTGYAPAIIGTEVEPRRL